MMLDKGETFLSFAFFKHHLKMVQNKGGIQMQRAFIEKGLEKEWEQHVVSAPINWLLDVAIHTMEMMADGCNLAAIKTYIAQCKLSDTQWLYVRNTAKRFSPRGEELFSQAA